MIGAPAHRRSRTPGLRREGLHGSKDIRTVRQSSLAKALKAAEKGSSTVRQTQSLNESSTQEDEGSQRRAVLLGLTPLWPPEQRPRSSTPPRSQSSRLAGNSSAACSVSMPDDTADAGYSCSHSPERRPVLRQASRPVTPRAAPKVAAADTVRDPSIEQSPRTSATASRLSSPRLQEKMRSPSPRRPSGISDLSSTTAGSCCEDRPTPSSRPRSLSPRRPSDCSDWSSTATMEQEASRTATPRANTPRSTPRSATPRSAASEAQRSSTPRASTPRSRSGQPSAPSAAKTQDDSETCSPNPRRHRSDSLASSTAAFLEAAALPLPLTANSRYIGAMLREASNDVASIATPPASPRGTPRSACAATSTSTTPRGASRSETPDFGGGKSPERREVPTPASQRESGAGAGRAKPSPRAASTSSLRAQPPTMITGGGVSSEAKPHPHHFAADCKRMRSPLSEASTAASAGGDCGDSDDCFVSFKAMAELAQVMASLKRPVDFRFEPEVRVRNTRVAGSHEVPPFRDEGGRRNAEQRRNIGAGRSEGDRSRGQQLTPDRKSVV